jgi:hypothetical protein
VNYCVNYFIMSTRAPYLPPIWEDDSAMSGLMSMPKARHINPTNYDRVIEFWQALIGAYCKHNKSCVFSLDELKTRFRRGSLLPSPLQTVLQEMQKAQLIQTEEDLQKRRQGWVQWGASLLNPTAWMSNGFSDVSQSRLVHLPVLKELSQELLDFYRTHYEMADCPEVVAYEELKERSEHTVNPQCFDLVIDELAQQGEVSLGFTKSGEKVLKFKDQGSRGPARFTDADASVHEIRRALAKIESEIKKAELRVKKHKEDALKAHRAGDRNSALLHLKKKKRAEKDVRDKDIQCERLLSMLEQLAQTKQTREILDVYRSSSKAFKESLNRQGLHIDNVDEAMDSVHEVMQDFNDIDEAIHTGLKNLPAGRDSIDEADLENELSEILGENNPADNSVKVGGRVLDLLDDFPQIP